MTLQARPAPARRRPRRAAIVASVLVLCAAAGIDLGRAQGMVELTPYYGYRLGGEFDDIDFGGAGDLEIEDSGAYGVILSFNVHPNAQVDLQYSHQSSELQGGGGGFLAGSKIFDLDADVFLVGGNYTGGRPSDPLRGFIGFALGVTDLQPQSPGLDGDAQFAFSFYGGAKIGLAKHVGLRLQGQWISTYIDSNDELWCDPFGFCYVVSDANYLSQFEVSAGLAIKF